MDGYDTFLFYAGTCPSVESAAVDYQAVKDQHYELGLIDTFDATIVGKKNDGRLVGLRVEQP